MDLDTYISRAIETGARDGVRALDPNQRLVFLISEAEVLCDMEGIDSFLDRYAAEWLGEAADAFAAVGATEIATGLRAIAKTGGADALMINQTNTLVTQRIGYDYDAVRRVVEERLANAPR